MVHKKIQFIISFWTRRLDWPFNIRTFKSCPFKYSPPIELTVYWVYSRPFKSRPFNSPPFEMTVRLIVVRLIVRPMKWQPLELLVWWYDPDE